MLIENLSDPFHLLQKYNIETSGKHCVVIGRSNIVGSPISILLAKNTPTGNCTVTLCHSKTSDIKSQTLQADIIICALGKPEFQNIKLTARGGGTGTNGQSLNHGFIVDFNYVF